ncbi:TPA: hypothetical protein DEP34_02115 [Candidatus Uhrbacteria bacterium]|uniref:Cell wall protein n=2 Tax=Candidatus Uhriibacteriota TaxID=1752732 RepID=A0A0G1Q7S5_9BACT|nr:MAG: Cell wall protein [Candidatus Uhrbacteria bacterium GW2011_GWF2_46_218]KKU40907.1 MAG: Cell wall protein [Candidatus Uhrbacteria bacterium GW2011_GWE2_46_68]HBK33971.1 hypothetical protein [Candidatus Uhrbacteria bacterium]HCB19157.1 hypothetical protein [Candidatus Uhrbacteria bacterium]
MEDTTHNRTYADLPEDVLLFLSDVDAVDQAQAFLKKYGGKEEDAALLLGTGEQIVLGAKALEDLPKILTDLFGIEESKVAVAAAEYATVRLLPIAGAIGDVSGQIVKWGGKLGDLSQNQGAILPQVTAEQFVAHVIEELKITEAEPDPAAQHRLLLLLSSYVKGIRDLSETKDALMRGEKIGGMELPEEIADELLSYVNDKMKFLRIADAKKEEPSHTSTKPVVQALPRPRVLRDIKQPTPPLAQKPVEPKPVVPPPVSPPAVSTKPLAPIIKKPEPVKEEDFGKAEEREVKEIANKRAVATSFSKETVQTDQIAQMILQKINLPLTDQLQKRFAALVDARLCGVRDADQTRQHLAKPILQGGLGMAGEMLVKVSDILEEEVGRVFKPHGEKIAQEKQKSFQEQRQKSEQKKEVDTRESQLLSKRYASITGKAPTESVEPMHATGVRVTASQSISEHLDRQEEKIDKAKVRQVIEAAKPPAFVSTVSHSTPTILPAGDRSKVQDVHFAKHLEGSVEELKRMTLVDFRRLASSASASVDRVVDKIELLREQGPDRMVAGVQAWKQSPLYLSYVALAKEAVLSGQSIKALLAEKRKMAPDELGNEELDAIMSINEQLRY